MQAVLESLPEPLVLVIDALDEVVELGATSSAILVLIRDQFKALPKVIDHCCRHRPTYVAPFSVFATLLPCRVAKARYMPNQWYHWCLRCMGSGTRVPHMAEFATSTALVIMSRITGRTYCAWVAP